MSPLAAQGPSLYEVHLLVQFLTTIAGVVTLAGVLAWLHRWWEDRNTARRFPPPLTREQLAARGAPPFPYDLASWEDLGVPANVDHMGRTHKVGLDLHTRSCTPTSCACPPARDSAKAGR